MRRAAFALALASLSCIAASAVSTVYASIPDADGIIHACFKNSSASQGALRVIDPNKGQSCANNESPLAWSQSSPEVPKISVSQAAGPGIIVPGDFPPAATVSITAPTAGHVLVNAWTTITGLAADQFAFVKLRDTVSGAESSVQGAHLAAAGVAEVSVGWLFEVAAGEQVFELGVRGVGGTINPGSSTITAVFVPD